jgi:hypothetical protein
MLDNDLHAPCALTDNTACERQGHDRKSARLKSPAIGQKGNNARVGRLRQHQRCPNPSKVSSRSRGFALAPKNTGTFFIDEVGYKTKPQPGSPFTWIRGGFMYNTADFTDLRSSDPDATIKGNEGVFFLADRQLWQQDPTSSHGAGRGIYAGFTYMGAPAKKNAHHRLL